MPRRRRTRSRRLTRRLHRTRRQRGGADPLRMSMDTWRVNADQILAPLKEAKGEGRADSNLLEILKSSTLTLTQETAPLVLSREDEGRSNMFVPDEKNTQNLASAISNVIDLNGQDMFSSQTAFKNFVIGLINSPDDNQKRTYEFLSELEATIRGKSDVKYVDIKDDSTYPLYIWTAAANVDRAAITPVPFLGAPQPPSIDEAPVPQEE
jgi:hypothetical protein